ncbi:TetR/AcrR family transcriptional regulator [Paenibacillus soyae]|uniref:TetR/AcrR family transcriptional regulator n=1 Tax=Paenibacillus soyae TaxID=2969249 RepID=A0A9X2SAJ2_9BACL|nr:TetR/AcrR family transcriptional regulator [Paenibacillus soyae]MCR2806764.1 TetR/AcrR family transcriptional regulator [Paenibacillus soyae]
MNRKQQQTEVTKARLMEAAFAIFSHRGYVSASIEEIACATGTSKANIYYHFKSKEGLFLALLDRYDAEWMALWEEQRVRYHSVAEMLHGMINMSLPQGFHHPLNRAAREFLDDAWGKSEEGRRLFAERVEEKRLFLIALLQEGIDSGELKTGNVSELALILESLFRGLGETTRDMKLDDAMKIYNCALEAFLHGIAAKCVGNGKE